MAKNRIGFILFLILILTSFASHAQVSSVTFGKNRVQYKKFKWQYYQTKNFNSYFNQDGQELAKYVAQVAEEELPGIEDFEEYRLQRRVNIVIYNDFTDMKQSNIGLGIDWQNTGGLTKLVNNKMVVYFNGDHYNLRKQIKEGIARVLTENLLFGSDIGEVVGNETLLDLPKWLTDGYISFAGENWSTALDDQLKSEILSEKYKNFYSFAFDKPDIAGHAFWYYIQEKYKKENVTYLLYLARTYKNLNKACMQVCKKKFKYVLADFMEYEAEKYDKDISKRKPYPKGSLVGSFEITKRHDYYRINVNPNKRNSSYAFVEYKKGIVRLKLYDDDNDNTITLLKYGTLSYQNETDPNYPLMAWDPKGTRLAVVYSKEGRLNLFVYDLVTRIKPVQLDLTDTFTQIQDIKYMIDSKTVLLSAVRNGHSDLYSLGLSDQKLIQITDDVYDDIDPSFVAFPNKMGIIFASNRPSPYAKSADTVLPGYNRYNIFLITYFGGKAEMNQVTQLSNLKYGDARFPMQYNSSHFTFISDENGVGNRYAGFFTTKSAGLDTLVLINGDILRNPSESEVDSALRANRRTDVDSVAVIAVSQDSSYTFPLTNYESSVAETRIAGENNQVSEVTRESDEKSLYKLKIDENTLKRRNVTVPPTEYMKQIVMADNISKEQLSKYNLPVDSAALDSARKQNDVFQSEFENDKSDSDLTGKIFSSEEIAKQNVLKRAKLYKYKPVKFYLETTYFGFDNIMLGDRYQPYQGGAGPITPTIDGGSGLGLDLMTKISTSELMEDQKILFAYRLPLSQLRDNEELVAYENYKRRLDWGVSYYRKSEEATIPKSLGIYFGKSFTNIYQANISYPFDETKSIKFSLGFWSNDSVVTPVDPTSLLFENKRTNFLMSHAEYVHDNTLNPATNIWNGLRYKVFIDWNTDISKAVNNTGKYNFNWGFDARYYYPIYRNFIWAGRAAGDFSWGSQKTVYYVGGQDGWLIPNFNSANRPASDQTYAFQALENNLRGFDQNVANGNNAIILNSEFRFPVITTLFNKPVNNGFLRNFQITQFIDLGNAWNGSYKGLSRPEVTYAEQGNPVIVTVKAGGIGPLAGGYGFGARSMLLGYFLKLDAGWPMVGFFRGKPIWYFGMGLDF